MASATLLASLEPDALARWRSPRFVAAMDEMSASAFKAYRGLVYETDGFRTFFRQMTPIAEIADLKIGSRPASRTKSRRDRGSARHPLGVQLGAGARDAARLVRRRPWALKALRTRRCCATWLEAWPFFAATLANLEMVLAKSDMDIAERYAALVEDQAMGDSRSSARSATAGNGARCAAGDHRPDAAARRRIPRSTSRSGCACPISSRSTCLQIELIKRHRAGEDRSARRARASSCRSTRSRPRCAIAVEKSPFVPSDVEGRWQALRVSTSLDTNG
jgi:phosphoenolpyruvate carboxylase